jgi:hypothetical protein
VFSVYERRYSIILSKNVSIKVSLKSLSTATNTCLSSGFRWGEGFRVRSTRISHYFSSSTKYLPL